VVVVVAKVVVVSSALKEGTTKRLERSKTKAIKNAFFIVIS
jgi:hypothetical protein